MASFTDYTEKKLLDHLFGIASYTPPAIYAAIGLYNGGAHSPWGENGTGGTEPPGADGYSRAAISAWDAITSEIDGFGTAWRCRTSNTNAVEWGPATTAWGTDNPRYTALFDDPTAGNCLAYGDITTADSHLIATGKKVNIAAGEWRWFLENTATIGVPKVFSEYTKRKLLEHLFGIASFTPPTALYLGLTRILTFTAGPPETVTASYAEESGTGYARVNVTSSWNAAVTAGDGRGMIDNSAAINFPTAGANWINSTSEYMTLFDASTGGNLLMWFKDPSNTLPFIGSGDRLVVPANYLQVYLN